MFVCVLSKIMNVNSLSAVYSFLIYCIVFKRVLVVQKNVAVCFFSAFFYLQLWCLYQLFYVSSHRYQKSKGEKKPFQAVRGTTSQPVYYSLPIHRVVERAFSIIKKSLRQYKKRKWFSLKKFPAELSLMQKPEKYVCEKSSF